MALRLEGGGYSYDGTLWAVYLYGPGTGKIDAHLGEDIVSIRYEGDGMDLNTPIIPSSCSIVIKASNQAEIDANEALLSEIALAGEGEFILKVYKNSLLHWVGLVLADQTQFSDDRLPRPLTIRAVDGLARLKEIEFNKDATEFASLAYLSQHIIIALQKTGIFAELSPGLRTSTGWTNAENTYASFLEGIRLDHVVWLYIDKKGEDATTTNKRSKYAWQVLEELAKLFHARVLMSAGSFWFIQIPQYLNAATAGIHNFDANGTVVTTGTGLPIAYSNVYTQAIGANWEYQAAIKRAKVTYRHASAENLNIVINFLTGPVVVKDIESFDGTAKFLLSFSLSYPTTLPASYPTYLSHFHKFKATIKIGDKWLKQTAQIILGEIIYTAPTWVSTAADYEFFVYPNFAPNGFNRYNFNLVSPPIPADGDFSVSLAYVHTYFPSNSGAPIQTITPFEWAVNNANFQVLPSGLIEDAFNETVFTQEGNATATKQFEFKSTVGDGPYSYTLTTMKARRPEGTTPPPTSSWTGSGSTGTIHQVLANSVVKFSGKNVKKINIPFIGGDYFPHGMIEYEEDFYLMLNADFNARANRWNGLFVQVADGGNGIALPPKKFISSKPSPRDIEGPVPVPYFPTVPDDGKLDLPNVKKADMTILRGGIPTTTDEPIEVGVVTSIPINPFDLDRVLLAGDKIMVTDIYTGKPTVFTVAANTTAGASSVSVVSQTITDRIVDGSYIQLDPEYLYTRALTNLANVGTGVQIFKDKVNQVANLRTLVAGSNITLVQNTNEIVISAAASGSMSFFVISANSGASNNITDAETLLISGNSGISTFVSTNQIAISLDISTLIAVTAASGDYLAIYDVSAGFHRRITIQDIINLVPAGFTSFTISANTGTANSITNGETLSLSGSSGISSFVSTNQVTFSLDISSLTAVTAASGDYLAIYDVSAGFHRRITVQDILNLVSSGGSMSSFFISADSGTSNSITDSETLSVLGGTAVNTSVGTNQVTVNFNIMKLALLTPTSDDFLCFYDNNLGQHGRAAISTILALGGGGFTSFNIAGNGGSSNAITNGETLTISGATGITTSAVTNGVIVSMDIGAMSGISTISGFDRLPIYDNSTGGHGSVSFNQVSDFIGVKSIIFTNSTNASGIVSVTHGYNLSSPAFTVVICSLTTLNSNAGFVRYVSGTANTATFEVRKFDGTVLSSESVQIHVTMHIPPS